MNKVLLVLLGASSLSIITHEYAISKEECTEGVWYESIKSVV